MLSASSCSARRAVKRYYCVCNDCLCNDKADWLRFAEHGRKTSRKLIGTIVGNELRDDGTGISLGPGSSIVEGNMVAGGSTGIVILSGSPSVVGNTIEGVSGQVISIAGTSSPTVSGNTMCGNGEDLYVSASATPEIGDNNVIRSA